MYRLSGHLQRGLHGGLSDDLPGLTARACAGRYPVGSRARQIDAALMQPEKPLSRPPGRDSGCTRRPALTGPALGRAIGTDRAEDVTAGLLVLRVQGTRDTLERMSVQRQQRLFREDQALDVSLHDYLLVATFRSTVHRVDRTDDPNTPDITAITGRLLLLFFKTARI